MICCPYKCRQIQERQMKNKILLNVCCAPDATHTINALRESDFEPVTFFYNPNIHPRDEYYKRVDDMKKLAVRTCTENIEDVPYDIKEWFRLCKPFSKEPERGRRCEVCFRMRMDKTAQKAKELNIEIFATTLTISPHKDTVLINRIGKEAAKKYGGKYYESNFKKQDGFKKSIVLSKEHDLYRQDYCGCSYSLLDRLKHKRGQCC
jgi:predicted adenine nucleotide alpha hydrolase (AANH) superfamily ATPase